MTIDLHAASASLALVAVFAANPDLEQSVMSQTGPQAEWTRTAAAQKIRAHFACNGGKSVDATFVNGAQNSVALTLSDGRSLTLPQVVSGSGARYANASETFVFWNKGNTAFIEENGRTTYDGCSTQPRR